MKRLNCKLQNVMKLLRTFMQIHIIFTFARPAGKVPPSVNSTLLGAGIMCLNHNEYKLINAIRNYND